MHSPEDECNFVIYTSVFNNQGVLIDPEVKESSIDYICFTDEDSLTSDIWKIKVIDSVEDPAQANRRFKALPHEYLPDYNVSLYLSNNIQIEDNIKPLFNDYLSSNDFAVYKNPNQSYNFEENNNDTNGDFQNTVQEQTKYYRNAVHPDDTPILDDRILFRRHQNSKIKEVMSDWWQEVSSLKGEDRFNLMFVLRDQDVEYNLLPQSSQEAPQFTTHPHPPGGYLRKIWPYWMSIRIDSNRNLSKKSLYYSGRGLSILKNEGGLSLINKVKQFIYNTIKKYANTFGDKFGIIGPDQIYSSEYYSKRKMDPYRGESHHIADVLIDQFNPDNVIDFGCAIGTYLERFKENDVIIRGVEGNSAAFCHAVVPTDCLEQHDLRQPYESDDYYDLVLSVEVAEHIPERYASTFVNTLAKSGEIVVMTAAPPGQGGKHHVNEKPLDYWIELFETHDMTYDSETTQLLKSKLSADTLYHVRKNIMVFTKAKS